MVQQEDLLIIGQLLLLVPEVVVAQEAALLTSMVQAVLQVVDKVLVLALVLVQEEVHQLQ